MHLMILQGLKEESLKVYQQIITIVGNLYGNYHLNNANLFYHFGEYMEDKGQFERAYDFYSLANKSYDHCIGREHIHRVTVLKKLSNMAVTMNFEGSKEYVRENLIEVPIVYFAIFANFEDMF